MQTSDYSIPFLEKVVLKILADNSDLGNLVIISPGRSAIRMMRKYLKKHCKKASFSPTFLTIKEFISHISGLKEIKEWHLLLEFYQVYKDSSLSQKSEFEDFYGWANILLSDFDEMDKFISDENKVFSYLKALYEIENWSPDRTQTSNDRSDFWEKVPSLYNKIKANLLKQKKGYEGMLYLRATERAAEYLEEHSHKKFVFLGFSALSKSEEFIFELFLESGRAKIYWDIDAHFLNDPDHEAGLFIRSYKERWKYYKNNPFEWIGEDYHLEKTISIVGVSKNIGQINYTLDLIKDSSPLAIILGDEKLSSVLATHSTQTGVDMSHPLSQNPWAYFFRDFLSLYYSESNSWHYKDVIKVISQSVFKKILPSSDNLIRLIHNNNQSYVSIEYVKSIAKQHNWPILNHLFFETKSSNIIESIVNSCINIIGIYLKEGPSDFYVNYKSGEIFGEIFRDLKQTIKKYPYIKSVKTLSHILDQIISDKRVYSTTDSASETQVMGMLESRALDFENLVITSVNENIIPSSERKESFLTYELRKNQNMATYSDKEAVYTYNFYRLLQRAQNVFLLYNTDDNSFESCERSRYILQLETDQLPNHSLKYFIADAPQSKPYVKKLYQISKDELYLKTLKTIAKSGFSPSGLGSFIYNPIDFYKKYILGLSEKTNIEESIARNTFGSIIHDTLESFYKPFEGKYINSADVSDMLKSLKKTVAEVFIKYTGNKFGHQNGKNHILYHIILEYLSIFLNSELKTLKAGHSLKILNIECPIKNIPILNSRLDFEVFIKGKVDRIDIFDDTFRIIDYKSGSVNGHELKVKEVNSLIDDSKYSKAFQVLMYSLMVYESGLCPKNIQAGIISFRNLKSGFMPFSYNDQEFISSETLKIFKEQLVLLILEIGDLENSILEKESSSRIFNSLF